MPNLSGTACAEPGCAALSYDGRHYCPAHRKEVVQRRTPDRPSSSARGYTYSWQKLRKWHLKHEPFCRIHLARGVMVAASEVDHVVPKHLGGSNRRENLQSLCKPCHSRKTRVKDMPQLQQHATEEDGSVAFKG